MKFINLLSKKIHYQVPLCPRCNGNYTGRYIIGTKKEAPKLIQNHLNKRERVRVINVTMIPYNNCFCDGCGLEWHGIIKKLFISNEEWNSISDKQIDDEALEFKCAKYIVLDEIKQKKKERRKQNLIKAGKITLFFFTGYKIKDKKKDTN